MSYVDFDHVRVDDLKSGMMINVTLVRGSDSENFLVLGVERGSSSTKIKVLDPEGLTDVIFFSNSPKGTQPPMVRVYPRDEDDTK